MTVIYQAIKGHTRLSSPIAAAISFYFGIFFWFLLGACMGVLFCRITGCWDYQNTVGGAGAFCSLVFGFIIGFVRLIRHA